MKLPRIFKSLIPYVAAFSMVMPSVALAAAQCDTSQLDAIVKKCSDEVGKYRLASNSKDNATAAVVALGGGAINSSSGTCSDSISNDIMGQQAVLEDCDENWRQCEQYRSTCSSQVDSKCKTPIKRYEDGLKQNIAELAGSNTACQQVASDTNDWQPGDSASTASGDPNNPSPNGPLSNPNAPRGPGGPSSPGSLGSSSSPTAARPSSTGLGGGGNMMGSLMPLAAMAAMMAAQQNQNQQQQQQAAVNGYSSPDGVVDSSGKVNCGATYAYRYSACNTQVSQACMANVTTMASSQVCEQFSARYCNAGYTPPQFYSQCPYPYYAGETCGTSYFTTPSPTQATQVDIIGEGAGTGYCLRASQIQFCSVATNAQCPSCLQLQSLQSTACVSNPALCNVSSSPTLTAAQLSSCPATDPLVSAGVISGNTIVAGGTIPTPTTIPPTGVINGPPAVLPLASASGASFNGLKVASSINGRNPSNVIGDVAPEYGQSIFSAGSTPLSQRCAAGLLNHCIR